MLLNRALAENFTHVRADQALTGRQQAKLNLSSIPKSVLAGVDLHANATSQPAIQADVIAFSGDPSKAEVGPSIVMGSSPTEESYIRKASIGNKPLVERELNAWKPLVEDEPRTRTRIAIASQQAAVTACKLVLSIIWKHETERLEIFRSAFDKLKQSIANNNGAAVRPAIDDPISGHSELDFPAAIRFLPVRSRATEWENVAGLFMQSVLPEETREGRQQIGALIVASAYVPLGEINGPLTRFFRRIDLDSSRRSKSSALGEVNKRIIVLSDLEERTSVFFRILDRAPAIPPRTRLRLLDRIANVIPFLPKVAQEIAMERIRIDIIDATELFIDDVEGTVLTLPQIVE